MADDSPEPAPALSGYDAELQRHDEVFRRACDVRPGDRVLDIGCGSGETTRQAARMASGGRAVGVDVLMPAIDTARELASEQGLNNVSFEVADAQVHHFAPDHFDLVISRFGTMFFNDPRAAFVNIGGALRSNGRLAMMVWQAREFNEWAVAVQRALEPQGDASAGSEAAFSLGNPLAVKQILTAAGFTGVTFADVREPVYYGRDVAAALAWVRGFATVSNALDRLDSDGAATAMKRLGETLMAHLSDAGVWFDSRAWLITAQRTESASQY